MRARLASLASLLFLFSPALRAEPFALEKVPEPLRPWVSWVLDGHDEARCPGLAPAGGVPAGQRPCFWPARLTLSLDERSGRFHQDWQAYKDGWVPLPGDARRWPQDVTVDGKPAAAVLQAGVPSVRLAAGAHAVAGAFRYDSLPELLQVPRETGLLSLSIRGAAVAFPNRDEEGRLWLAKSKASEKGEDRLVIVVHRRVIDDIPLMVATDLELKVSGKNREALLARVLPPQFIPTSLRGPLPARLEKDGRLRVQLRPGDWRLELAARREGPVTALGLAPKAGPQEPAWDKEVWVFDARPDLRLVTVEGVPSIDPQQTELPPGWRQLPAYLVRPGDTMKLVERRRGDSEPAPDELSLQRTWWLDFDGRGWSVRDRIQGALRRGWRVEMAEPTALGRVAVDGADQFITALPPAPGRARSVGIEVRRGAVNIEADSRLDGARSAVPAVGWNHDFHQVSATLNLPPGWRLIHAAGVDDAEPTWVTAWTLLDLFIALMAALAVGKLYGPRWGALALAALALCWHEPGAPRWILVFLLAFEALARALPEGALRRSSEWLRLIFRAALVIVAVPFLIGQVRRGVYPQLGNPDASSARFGDMVSGVALEQQAMISGAAAASPEAAFDGRADRLMMKAKMGGMMSNRASVMRSYSQGGYYRPGQDMNVFAPDLKAEVTTGPGMPEWSWQSVSLTWRGPVKRSQRMFLVLIGPFGNLVLALLRSALLVLLTVLLLGLSDSQLGARLDEFKRALGYFTLLLALGLSFGARPAAAEMPTPDLLRELQARLLRPAECEPQCASISRLRLEVSPGALTARLELAASAPAAVPLPGSAQQWTPARVVVDGFPAKGLWRSPGGLVYLAVAAGSHQVIMDGPLPDRESVEIPLPLAPHRVEASASGWAIDGVREDGTAADNVALTRLRAPRPGAPDVLQPGSLPPFLRVERLLRLGLSWQVSTRVIRVTPLGTAVVAEVPLLAGESVTTPDIRVENGKVKLSLGPQAAEAEWTSVLAQAPSVVLKAPDSAIWTELWRVEASPIWHLAAEGIPVVHSEDPSGARLREWRPWPGETATLAVSRPEGVPGRTTTVDRTNLSVSPGLRATDVRLDVSLRASRGGQQTLTLPEGAELQTLSMDGAPQPVRQEKRSVTVPILPGSHQLSLAWRQADGMTAVYRVPEVKLGLPTVNASVSVAAPYDRWVLAAWGPRLGPAVLFWSVLAVMLLLSLGLGRATLTPLSAGQWFLLSIGLTQLPVPVAAVVAGWLLVLGVRKRTAIESPLRFNLVQLVLAFWTIAALTCLYAAIQRGLLGQPEMQVSGNGSSASLLCWYQDRTGELLPRPGIVSLPRLVYRLAMLAWALWIASSLLSWLSWGWTCFNEGGLWKALPRPAPRPGNSTAPGGKPKDGRA